MTPSTMPFCCGQHGGHHRSASLRYWRSETFTTTVSPAPNSGSSGHDSENPSAVGCLPSSSCHIALLRCDGTRALLPVDLEIHAGEVIALLGPSGRTPCGRRRTSRRRFHQFPSVCVLDTSGLPPLTHPWKPSYTQAFCTLTSRNTGFAMRRL